MEIERTEKQISVASPYNPDLPSSARKLGGKWDGSTKLWTFDIRDEARVEELYRNIYGEWDSDIDIPICTVKVTATSEIYEGRGGIFICGRQVARATGRDSGARLGTGVVILKGIGAVSGGSVKNWATIIREDSIFEIRDVPVEMAKKEMDNPDPDYTVEIVGDTNIDKELLIAEKAKLLTRIEEIDNILNS